MTFSTRAFSRAIARFRWICRCRQRRRNYPTRIGGSFLAHTDPQKAFEKYAEYSLSTNGQVYWSDTHQLSIYPDNYHREIDEKLHAPYPATEIITEIDVPGQC